MDGFAQDPLSFEAALLVGSERRLVAFDNEELNTMQVPIIEREAEQLTHRRGAVAATAISSVANPYLEFRISAYRIAVLELAGAHEASRLIANREEDGVVAVLNGFKPAAVMRAVHGAIRRVEEDQLTVVDPFEQRRRVFLGNRPEKDLRFVWHMASLSSSIQGRNVLNHHSKLSKDQIRRRWLTLPAECSLSFSCTYSG